MAYYNGKEGTYTIKKGDNLTKIAKAAGVTVKEIASWNNIKDVNKIRAGAKLNLGPSVPAVSAVTPTVATPSVPAASPVEKNVVGVVNGEINEGDIYKTQPESRIPKITEKMRADGVSEYDWTVEGKAQGFLEHEMKVQEAKRVAIEQKSKIDYAAEKDAAGKAEVVTRQNKNKMGITGHAADDMDRRVVAANNARALNLYSQEDMIKYGYETGVKVATLYGNLKERQVTAEEYNKAIDRAAQEAQRTGIYKDPIAIQLLEQRKMAVSMTNNPYATQEEKARALQVTNGVRNAFLELGLSDKGVETLEKTYQEANIKLQQKANSIAEASNSIQSRAIRDSATKFALDSLMQSVNKPTKEQVNYYNKKFGVKLKINDVTKEWENKNLGGE